MKILLATTTTDAIGETIPWVVGIILALAIVIAIIYFILFCVTFPFKVIQRLDRIVQAVERMAPEPEPEPLRYAPPPAPITPAQEDQALAEYKAWKRDHPEQ